LLVAVADLQSPFEGGLEIAGLEHVHRIGAPYQALSFDDNAKAKLGTEPDFICHFAHSPLIRRLAKDI
jgi:hypothetical protein